MGIVDAGMMQATRDMQKTSAEQLAEQRKMNANLQQVVRELQALRAAIEAR